MQRKIQQEREELKKEQDRLKAAVLAAQEKAAQHKSGPQDEKKAPADKDNEKKKSPQHDASEHHSVKSFYPEQQQRSRSKHKEDQDVNDSKEASEGKGKLAEGSKNSSEKMKGAEGDAKKAAESTESKTPAKKAETTNKNELASTSKGEKMVDVNSRNEAKDAKGKAQEVKNPKAVSENVKKIITKDEKGEYVNRTIVKEEVHKENSAKKVLIRKSEASAINKKEPADDKPNKRKEPTYPENSNREQKAGSKVN